MRAAVSTFSLLLTCILTLVTQPFCLQSTLSGKSAPDALTKGAGALWMSVGGVSVAKDCRISSGVCQEATNTCSEKKRIKIPLKSFYHHRSSRTFHFTNNTLHKYIIVHSDLHWIRLD